MGTAAQLCNLNRTILPSFSKNWGRIDLEIQFHSGSFAVPQDEVHCRCTQQLLKALQLQHEIGSDLSGFIISLGNQGATSPKHPRLSPLSVTAMPGSEGRATPPVPVSPTRYFTSQRSGRVEEQSWVGRV